MLLHGVDFFNTACVLSNVAVKRFGRQRRLTRRRSARVPPRVQHPDPRHEEDGRRAEQEEARQRALRAGVVAADAAVVVVVVSIINAAHKPWRAVPVAPARQTPAPETGKRANTARMGGL